MFLKKYIPRPSDAFQPVCCVFTVLGISLAAMATMAVTVTCRLIGQIESQGTMSYWCAVGEAPGGGFSLTIAYCCILLGSLILTLTALLLVYACHKHEVTGSGHAKVPPCGQQVVQGEKSGLADDREVLLTDNAGVV